MSAARPRLAVLIDADNVSPEAMNNLFVSIGEIGNPIVREIYGGSDRTSSQKWSNVMLRHALCLGRQAPQSGGRNATDIEMVIGAMDLLSNDRLQGYCLVSSDSDFTALAIRLRKSGKLVFGFGEKKTPDSFRYACHEFRVMGEGMMAAPSPPAGSQPLPLKQAVRLLNEAFEKCAIGGWAVLPTVGKRLKADHPGFAPASYGAASLKKLIKTCGRFDLEFFNSQDAYRPAAAKPALKLVKP